MIGLLLITGTIAWVLFCGIRAALASGPANRPWAAAATAACIAFVVAATIDWVWELTVVPVAFLLLAAALMSGGDDEPKRPAGPRGRIAIGLLAAAAVIAIAVPLAGTSSVRASQVDVNASQLGPALESARDAREIQPWAATPHLQEALVLELQGDLDAAAAAASNATRDEPTNWRTWLVLSRIEAYRGNAGASVNAFREARDLNPRSPLFAQ